MFSYSIRWFYLALIILTHVTFFGLNSLNKTVDSKPIKIDATITNTESIKVEPIEIKTQPISLDIDTLNVKQVSKPKNKMARKTFISYKFSEAQDLRNEILESLGEDASYYQGETSDSPDLTDTSTENIKDMMFATSISIVIISPSMINSDWIDWEIEYTLKEIKRGDTKSRTNGLVGIVMKVDGSYDWLISHNKNEDGCTSRYTDKTKLYDIINSNRFNNTTENKYSCSTCKSYDRLTGSYMSLIKEEDFLADPTRFIENSYDKSQSLDDFDLTKEK